MTAEEFLNESDSPTGKQLSAAAFLDEDDQAGTSIGQEISQIPAALKQSFGQPLEAIGETAQVAGFPAVATALKGAIQEPEGYVSAGERFMAPKEGEFQVAGFAPQYAPRAIAEQTGQILGSIGSRIAGAVTLGGLGALISPATGAAGVATGLFAGPALFEAAQIVGPVALERAKNNGYTEPTDEDMAYAIVTAAGSGLLNAFGAKYLPGGKEAIGSFSKQLAVSFLGEGVPEGLQSLVQQVGETVETKKGIQVSPKQAVGEALIGGGAGAAATIVSAPFTPEQIEEQKITESANKEAENLFIGNDNPQGKAVLANKQKLEQEIADAKQVLSAIESTDPVAQKLKLELKEKEAILAAAQGQVDSIVDSSDPVTEAEKQQIELAKAITTPEVVAPTEPAAPTTPAIAAQEGAKGMNLQEVSESAIAAFPDMMEAEGGLLPLSRFTPDEQASLQNAGIVETATTSTGETYEGVNAEYLWQRRKQLQGERAKKVQESATPAAEVAPAITPAPVEEVAPAEEPYKISKQPPALPEANAPATPAVGKPSPTKRISPERASQLQSLGFISNSDPGISIETAPNPPAFGGGWVANADELERRVVYRDENGKPKGYLRFYIKEQGSKAVDATEGLEVYVEPEYRRKGIAKQLYATASQAGYDVMSVSGTGAVSEAGAALSAALKQPAPVAETPAVTEAPAAEVAPTAIKSSPEKSAGVLNEFIQKELQRQVDEQRGQQVLDNMEEAGESPRAVVEEFYRNIYDNLPQNVRARFDKYVKRMGWPIPANMDSSPKSIGMEGAIDLGNDVQGLEGIERGFVALVKTANELYAQAQARPTTISTLELVTPAVSETITPAAEPAGKAEEVTPRKPATFPTMPSIEEQTAEKVYGGETGLYDPFAGVQKKRTKAEDPAGRRGTEDQIKNADEHAAEIGGTVLYQDGDISLIRGYSLWGGNPVYIVANKSSRARTDISSYTGNLATPEQKSQLVDIKNKIETEDQASFNSKPFITFTDGIAFSNGVPSTIAGVLRGWKSLLNIKANLYVTTYDDAVADKDKFNGPHRVIGSAGLASSKVDGSIRKMPNGDFYIMFREIPSRTKMLETLAHELGHLHEKEAFENADTATKRMLREEHDKWVKSQTGKTAKELVTSLRAVKTAKANLGAAEGMMADELSAYWKSFGEWYADQVSRWAVSTEKPLTIVDKFFSRIAKALRSFYANLTNRGYLPNETFVQYLEKTLKEPARIVSEPIMEGEGVEQLSQQLGGEPTRERQQIMGEKIGPLKKTPEGIIAETQVKLRERFDPTKVTEQNTTEAFRALGRLTGKDGTAFAQELNDIGRMVDESGAAAEVSMGAALFVNDLFEYAVRLAAQGNKKMLGIMMTNINRLPTGTEGRSDAGRALRAAREMKDTFLTMAQAEQDAYTNYVAEFIYGPNPTKEQIKSIKDAYAAVEKTTQITEKELTDEIKAVGDRSGTDLVGKINEEFTKATEKGREKRRTEEQELDREYKKVQRQADAEIEKLAKIQSDTPSFDPAIRQIINEVRAIVANDLKQRPDMESKTDWKSALIAKLQQVGVELTAAETLADIVWRQHEINNLSRELSSINKAIEKGPISEIVKAIKETPLEEQQNPNWRYEVMRDYLRKAGLPAAQAERIAKLMDISLQKRFTMAQEQAFTDAISKTAPWKAGDTRSRRAFQKVLQALRAGALDPARNVLSDMAALNGWTGFTPEQYKTLLKNDAILADPESADATKAEAHKAIQDIISKAKLPIRARDVIGQYYDAQALSGIQTATVNIFSPAGMAAKNALTQALNGLLTARPEQITASLTTFIDSIKSWANTVAYSFKNNVTVYSNVEYLVNDEGLLKLYKKGVDQFNNGKTPRDKADGVKNMMIGMMDYVRRILNALDYGAIASLQNQAVSKYALAVMQAKGMSSKDGAKMLNAMMEQKRNFYNDQIAIGTDKNKAAVLADEFFISSWRQALTDAKLPAQEVMDAALNDAMSSVGRNRQSLDAFREEDTNIRDEGVFSFPAIWLLETMANAANKQDNQFIKIFSRIIYGFAVVPARVFRETAWFSPYGAVRFAYDYIAKKMGKTSPYAQSLGNDLQYRQRLTETAAGTLVMLAFAAAMSSSTEDEEDKKPFKIVVTGNGPLRNEDPQYYDSWMKKNKPNTVSVYFGKTKFTINTMRGFEAFAWPAMMLGAVDDWNIRRKQKRETNTPKKMGDAAIIGGFVLSASLRRGPYAFAAKPLFESYGDRGVESLAKSLAFPAKTLLPGLGSSLAKNFSDLLNEPVDRKTLEGALWANIPFIGPAVASKSLNAFGEPALANEAADKIFKLGIPVTFNIPTDRESVKLHELVLKQGAGPSIPTRNQLAQRLDRQPTNKEYEMFVKEYGAEISRVMKENIQELSDMSGSDYERVVQYIGDNARDFAQVKLMETKKP